jgi:hypothetical protein
MYFISRGHVKGLGKHCIGTDRYHLLPLGGCLLGFAIDESLGFRDFDSIGSLTSSRFNESVRGHSYQDWHWHPRRVANAPSGHHRV